MCKRRLEGVLRRMEEACLQIKFMGGAQRGASPEYRKAVWILESCSIEKGNHSEMRILDGRSQVDYRHTENTVFKN